MLTVDFNAGWEYSRLGENAFIKVTLPHDAMLGKERVQGNPCGEVTAIALGKDGKLLSRNSLKTALDATYLGVIPEKSEVKRGEVKPLERHKIKVAVEGGH